ncbi:hypothetical protein NDU88_004897 [Pleurodeles waltl]|uniref:Uncharacterized protein n=1 Tax=Pleurodeles waltl TaxID=8319 RepID=A0AAV7TVK5_PLEWA|nr:hypothetical protein NDU88_004897 [Pleurodeles waltl]
MDKRVVRALELLKEAGRLDLITAPAAPRERPARWAASGVAAAVAACSPPRERTQVSGAGRGRNGRLALSHKGRINVASKRQPRPLGARRLRAAGRCCWGRGGNLPGFASSAASGAAHGHGGRAGGGWVGRGARSGGRRGWASGKYKVFNRQWACKFARRGRRGR